MNQLIRRAGSWAMWSAFAGLVCGLLVVLVFRLGQFRSVAGFILETALRPSFVMAEAITRLVFPGDLIHRVVDITTFFDGAFTVSAGLEFAVLGFGMGFLVDRMRKHQCGRRP